MPLQTFLAVLAATLGFVAGLFFIVGIARLGPLDIKRIASSGWGGFSRNLAYSLATQRGEYLAGSMLLAMSFLLQVASSLVPVSVQPAFLHSAGIAAAMLISLVAILLVGATVLRSAVIHLTRVGIEAMVSKDAVSHTPNAL